MWLAERPHDLKLTVPCSVFAGGFNLESACAVTGSDDVDDYAVLDRLDALVRKSLLVGDRSSGRTRFSMLETIRQLAEEQLVTRGVAEDTRAVHAHHFAGREANILALWDSPRQHEAYDWFTAELANLRTAFRWAADHSDLDDAATIATYATNLGFWVETYEPIAWAEELIEPADAVDHPRLAFLYVIASVCYLAGRIEAAVGYSDAAQRVIGNGRDRCPTASKACRVACTWSPASPNGGSRSAAPHAVATLTHSPGHSWSWHLRSSGPVTRR